MPIEAPTNSENLAKRGVRGRSTKSPAIVWLSASHSEEKNETKNPVAGLRPTMLHVGDKSEKRSDGGGWVPPNAGPTSNVASLRGE